MAAELTEDEVKAQIAAAVADAIAPLQAQLVERDAKIVELSDKVEMSETDQAVSQAVADAVAPLNTKVTELQTALDAAELARGTAEAESKAIGDWLEAEAEVAAGAERREARITAARDIWPEDTFDETKPANKDRIDRWAAMDDEVFDDLLEGWKATKPATAKADQGNGKLPKERTAMTDAVTEGAAGAKSPVRRLLESSIGVTGADDS